MHSVHPDRSAGGAGACARQLECLGSEQGVREPPGGVVRVRSLGRGLVHDLAQLGHGEPVGMPRCERREERPVGFRLSLRRSKEDPGIRRRCRGDGRCRRDGRRRLEPWCRRDRGSRRAKVDFWWRGHGGVSHLRSREAPVHVAERHKPILQLAQPTPQGTLAVHNVFQLMSPPHASVLDGSAKGDFTQHSGCLTTIHNRICP